MCQKTNQGSRRGPGVLFLTFRGFAKSLKAGKSWGGNLTSLKLFFLGETVTLENLAPGEWRLETDDSTWDVGKYWAIL